MKLVQLYKQVKEENGKLGKVLVTRRSPDERVKNFLIATNKQIQEYIKNGSKGNLNLENTPITSLPNDLWVLGELWVPSSLTDKYSRDEIRQMVPNVNGKINSDKF